MTHMFNYLAKFSGGTTELDGTTMRAPLDSVVADKTYNLNIELIEEHITEKTKAIMVVHLYGRVCWSHKLEEIAKNNEEAYLSSIKDERKRAEAKIIRL